MNPQGSAHYRFEWRDDSGNHYEYHRPALMEGSPETPEPGMTLIEWPHTDSIQIKVMEEAIREARRQQGLEPQGGAIQDDILALAVMHLVAPSARGAVNEVMRDNGQPGHLAADLEALQEELAQEAILGITGKEFHSLVLWCMSGNI